MFAFINARIYDYNRYLESGFIVFNQSIIEVGCMSEYVNRGYQELDLTGKLVLPGFVCGHTHLYSTFARGISLRFNPNNFLDILHQMWWKIDHFLDLDAVFYSAVMGGMNQLKLGTTTLIDHHASGKILGSLEMVKKAINDVLKMRGIFAFETSDRFNLIDCINENLDFINKNHNRFSSGLFGMHASLSLSDESLKEISNALNSNGIHIHVAESEMDETECEKRYGMRVVERLEKFNLINSKSLLVHCTHITEHEMEIIKKHDATIAVNVTSNLNNAVGISQIKKFLDKGIRVISGNDGLMQSMPNELMYIYYLSHLKTKSPTGFSLDDLLKIIKNNYDYVSTLLGVSLGQFDLGFEADFVISNYHPYTRMDESNAFSHIFFGVYPGFQPEEVYIGGKKLIENYKFIENFEDFYTSSNKKSEELWSIIKKEGEKLEFTD